MGHVEVGHRWERVAMDLLDYHSTGKQICSGYGGLFLQVDRGMPIARQDGTLGS